MGRRLSSKLRPTKTLSLFNLGTLKRVHQHFTANLAREIDAATNAEAMTSLAQRYVATNGPPRSLTGNLVKQTKAKLVRLSGGRIVRIQNAAPYAHAQDGGSGLYGPKRRRYLIQSKNGKMLRFVAKSGQVVFARKVWHPGVKPTRFLYNASDAVGRTLEDRLQDAMRRAAKKF